MSGMVSMFVCLRRGSGKPITSFDPCWLHRMGGGGAFPDINQTGSYGTCLS